MSDDWDPAKARKKLRAAPDMLACDALLDQDIFSGVGNIIKNEVLFRIRVHPASTVGALPPAKLRALVEEARAVQLRFPGLEKGIYPQAALAGARQEDLPPLPHPLPQGAISACTNRRSFWCERCQKTLSALSAASWHWCKSIYVAAFRDF